MMDKEQTALALLKMFKEIGGSKDKLDLAIATLIDIAYINPHFTDAMFQAQNIAKAHNIVRKL